MHEFGNGLNILCMCICILIKLLFFLTKFFHFSSFTSFIEPLLWISKIFSTFADWTLIFFKIINFTNVEGLRYLNWIKGLLKSKTNKQTCAYTEREKVFKRTGTYQQILMNHYMKTRLNLNDSLDKYFCLYLQV